MNKLTLMAGLSLIASIVLLGCGRDDSVEDDERALMEPAPAQTTPKCGMGQVLTCSCESGGKGRRSCLETGKFGECDCSAFEERPELADCQPGSRVVCDCPDGGTGNQLCRPDATFEPCSMCIVGEPDADAG